MKWLLFIPLLLMLSGMAFGQSVPTCNSFDASGAPIYSTAIPPDTTGTTNCTDYFGAANWANSPLPAGTITGFTLVAGGSGYANPVAVVTDITGATFNFNLAITDVTSGVITSITGGTGGANYTMPRVTVVDVGIGGTLAVPTCGGASQPACGSGAMATAVIGGTFTGGMLKFQDPLVDLKGHIATSDTTTFPGSDYYEIALVQYTQKMHTSLPPTTLAGLRTGPDRQHWLYRGLGGHADLSRTCNSSAEGRARTREVYQLPPHGHSREPVHSHGHDVHGGRCRL